MVGEENEVVRTIRAAISELISDSSFQIDRIYYLKHPVVASIWLNSSFGINVHMAASISDAQVYLEPQHRPQLAHHSFNLRDVFHVLGLEPVKIVEGKGIINKISDMMKLIKQNWSTIVNALDNEDIINQLLEIEREEIDALKEKTIRQIRDVLIEFSIDGEFRISQLDFLDAPYFGNVILTLETDTNVSIGFVRERSITECRLIVDGVPDLGNELWLSAVFKAIGVDPAIIRFPVTMDIVDCIPIIMKVIKQHWPLIVQAFNDEHRSDTVHKIDVIKTEYREEYEKRSRRLREYKNALKEFAIDDTFRFSFYYLYFNYDIGMLDNITLIAETETNVDILFNGDRNTIICTLSVMNISDDKENQLRLSYVFDAIGIDPTIVMLPSDVDFIEGVLTIMKVIKQHWPLIVQAFDDEHRSDTIRKVKTIKTKYEETSKTAQ
jgi:hypothetical protein